jgi:hypothetical protein
MEQTKLMLNSCCGVLAYETMSSGRWVYRGTYSLEMEAVGSLSTLVYLQQ